MTIYDDEKKNVIPQKARQNGLNRRYLLNYDDMTIFLHVGGHEIKNTEMRHE